MPFIFSHMRKFLNTQRSLATILMLSSLTACSGSVTSKVSPYDWGSYETQLYHHFDNATKPEVQLAALLKDEQDAHAKGKILPPGFYAQLGLLYQETGQIDQANAAFKEEEKLYPDSIPYMNHLLQENASQAATPTASAPTSPIMPKHKQHKSHGKA